MVEKEVLFAKTLESVKQLARRQGNCISVEQVEEAFAPLAFTEEQLGMVYNYLGKNHIGIGEPLEAEEYLTREEKDYLEIYLEQLRNIEEVSEGEKEAITLSAMAGDPAAQNRLIELYLSDVVEVAKLYAGQGVFLEDLIGEGNVALAMGVTMLGCLEHAAEAQGMLGKMMMDAMEEHIAETVSNSKIDQRAVNKVNKVMEKAKELSEELRRKVTPEELAQESGLSVAEIMDAVRISGYRIEYIEVVRDV